MSGSTLWDVSVGANQRTTGAAVSRYSNVDLQPIHGGEQKPNAELGALVEWKQKLPMDLLLGQWLNFKLFGITYLVGKIKFKLLFQGSIR